MNCYTHIVLDEVHERSMDMDILNILLKKCLQKSSVKLVVMSATLQSGLFGEYFTPHGQMVAESIFVGARRFPVEQIFLDDLLKALPDIKKVVGSTVCKLIGKFESKGEVKADVSPETRKVICQTVRSLAQAGSCILVFLPGMKEIEEMQDDFESLESSHVLLQVLVLHSLVPQEEQDLVMRPAMQGHCKVILSTNLAESSITIPDVYVVLDTGVHRSIRYDDKRGMCALMQTWCSKSSAKQRAGRAGRVAPGKVIYFFTRAFHEFEMHEFEEAEMTRLPLEKTVLQVMSISTLGSPAQLLSQALTPPPPERVQSAINALYQAGAITGVGDHAQVSSLGELAANLPIDLCLVKMILLGMAPWKPNFELVDQSENGSFLL
jgi:HrpA-like RNA helicase